MSTWILLRGLTREARHWGRFPENMAAKLGGVVCLTLDLPGNGQLNHQSSPWRVEDMADHCHGELNKLRQTNGLSGPVRVLAMSLGAMVAVAWAQRHPQDLTSLVLINTSLRPFSPLHHRLRPANYGRLLRLALPGDSALWESTVLDLTSQLAARTEPAARAALLGEWQHYRDENPVSRANALRQLWAASRYTAPLKPLAAKVLVVNGAGDRLVDPRCSVALAKAWHCPLLQHPTAGHDLPLDDPDWLTGALARAVAQGQV